MLSSCDRVLSKMKPENAGLESLMAKLTPGSIFLLRRNTGILT